MAEAREQQNFRSVVMKRFMTDAEWKAFRKEYWANRQRWGGTNRFLNLVQEISQGDKDLLEAYLTEEGLTGKEIAERVGIPNYQFHNIVRRTAVKLLYQNQGVLSRLL
jgi:DNA-directed RNA polymerase specialized sigma subunit